MTKQDLLESMKFVKAITGNEDTVIDVRALYDRRNAQPLTARILRGAIADLYPRLCSLNDTGYGIFMTINETDGIGVRTENIVGLRALFIDKDNGHLGEFIPCEAPSVIVDGQRGSHAYWSLRAGEPMDQFCAAQKHLISAFEADPCVSDLPRVMRIPGFLHMKAEPYLLKCRVFDTPKHTIPEVLGSVQVTAVGDPCLARSTRTPRTPSTRSPAAIRAYINKIPPVTTGRNPAAYKVAALHHDFSVPVDEFFVYLQEWNGRNPEPLSPTVLRRILNNSAKYSSGAVSK